MTVHPVQQGEPFPFSCAGPRLIDDRAGLALKPRNSASIVMRVREAAAQVGDFAERPAAEEGSRKATAICRESANNFGDMTTPLGNQLEPKVCQDRESFEHWEEAIARLGTKKSSVDKFWIVRLAWQAKR